MQRFSAFLDRKAREDKHHLKTLGEVLIKSGFKCVNHLDHHQDPYQFINKPDNSNFDILPYDGIRIYTIGNGILCFRPQQSHESEPAGMAYLLDVQKMYKNIAKEENSDKALKSLVQYLVEEIYNYFVFAVKAINTPEDLGDNKLGNILVSQPVSSFI